MRAALGRIGASPADVAAAAIDGSEHDSASFRRKYAVPLTTLYDRDACPVCEESGPYMLRERRIIIAADASVRPSVRSSERHLEEVAQTVQARTAITQADVKQHDLIFKLETELRGSIRDDRIAVYMLRLRRRLEHEFEDNGVSYVPWTKAMILEHFDVDNAHTDDPLRKEIARNKKISEQAERIKESFEVPSRADPGIMILYPAASKQYLDYMKALTASDERIERLKRAIDPNQTATLRGLTGALNSLARDEAANSVTVDPEASAGMQAAGSAARAPPGSARNIYEINAL